jgi:hypothetical protein
MIDAGSAILWTERCIACAIFLQSIELLLVRSSFSNTGVWRWNDLRKEYEIFSFPVQSILSFCLNYTNFIYLLILRTIFSLLLSFFSHPVILFFLLASTILIALRWRGTFNGGSDYMSVLVLAALLVLSLFPSSEKVQLAVLWYIAIQLVSSYFIAGVVKLKKGNWRNGAALKGFVCSTIYHPDRFTRGISENRPLVFLCSWSIILFEVTFFLSLIDPVVCIGYIFFALLFHVGNFYIFGLNRFIFAWLACYPALLFCSGL